MVYEGEGDKLVIPATRWLVQTLYYKGVSFVYMLF